MRIVLRPALIALGLVLSVALAQAQGLNKGHLENPGHGRHYSGVGVISGWHCLGGLLTVSFNGDAQFPLAYGSNRRDVREECGRRENTGFGTIFNWALLGAGTHTAVVYRDGIEFGRSTFTVGTTKAGDEFLEGVSARKTVRDFPRAGETTELVWNEQTQHLEIADWQAAPQASAYRPLQDEPLTALLENPKPGLPYSGIGIISGWKCSAVELTASVNGGQRFPVLYRSSREDTRGTCGDADNGFVVPSWNWGILGAGTHTVAIYDQGVEFARSTVIVGTAGEEFVEGVSKRITVFGFPYPLEQTDFEWNEKSQHFEMIGGPDISEDGPSFGTATIADQSYAQGTAIPALTLPAASGGTAPLTYSLSPALPAGLSFDASTRMLSGTPMAAQTATSYTYTATDAAGATATLSFSLTVTGGGPSFGSATIPDQSYTQNTAITSLILPQAGGGTAPLTYSLSPALPAGLSFNSLTRELSGTPTSTLSTTSYTYTVTDAGGATATLSFNLTVTGGGPSFGSATISDQSYTQNTAISALTLPAASGGTAPLTYSLNPSPPAGLNFNTSTRELSGTPTATQSATTYTYTATDATSTTATLTFTITVSAETPMTPTDDHGNSVGTATRVNYSYSVTPGNLETAGDRDYFSIDVRQEGIIMAETTGSTDTKGRLRIDGEDIYDDDSGPSRNFRVAWPVNTGTIHVRVEGFRSSTTGRYQLVVRWYDDTSFVFRVRDVWDDGDAINYRIFVYGASSGGPVVIYPRDAFNDSESYVARNYNTWYRGDSDETYTYCIRGEQVCIGAKDDERYEYGVGPDGDDGCSNCCFTCGTTDPMNFELGPGHIEGSRP